MKSKGNDARKRKFAAILAILIAVAMVLSMAVPIATAFMY